MRRIWMRALNLFRGARAEREMAREIEAHLALLQEDFEKRGMTPEEAALAARREYGGVEQAKELHRETRSFLWIGQFFKDLRYACADLRRNPGFTLLAAIALALGIGLNTTVFSLYNAIALKPLPVSDPARVVRVERWFASNSRGNGQYNFAFTEYQNLRDHAASVAAIIAAKPDVTALAEIDGATERVSGYAVSANYFRDLGVQPALGRSFLPGEDSAPGANPVVLLDYRFWQRQYNGAQDVIGRALKLNGTAYTIIGVAPREFTGTGSMPLEAAFWTPLSMLDRLDPGFDSSAGSRWRVEWRDASLHPGFELLARLKPGVSPAAAEAEIDSLARRYLGSFPQADPTTKITLQKTAYFGNTEDLRFRVGSAGVLVLVSLVLLVACANVANMLLARGAARQREIGIRLALGASRGRMIRQLLTESLLLSLLAGIAGVLLSVWSSRLLWVSLNGILEGFHMSLIDLDLRPDVRLLVYGIGLSVLTGALFGLAPALASTRQQLTAAMNRDATQKRLGRSKLRAALLGAQVTVSVGLLVFTFALAGALSGAWTSDLGFNTHDTYSLLTGADKDKAPALRERLESLPELSGVATGRLPLQGTYKPPMMVDRAYVQTLATFASDGFLETLGIPLLNGRNFTRAEAKQKAPLAVISESTAKHFWPGQNPLGKHFALDLAFRNKFTDFEVVGVTRDARFATVTEIDQLHVYLPAFDIPQSGGMVFRARGDHNAAVSAVRAAVESFEPDLTHSLDIVRLEDGYVALQKGEYRVAAILLAALTLIALTLAGIGIYGVMAFFVSQQTREIGIRAALGATSQGVLRAIVAGGLRPVFIGMALGFALGAAGNVIEQATEPFPNPVIATVFGEPSIYAGLALMLLIAILASLIPAHRALRVDPVVALRHD